MSASLKDVINPNLAGKESIVWMSVEVHALNETRTYYVPRFTTLPDVIDVERTTFVSETDHIIKPVFSLEKLVDYAIFCIPQVAWEIPSGLYVTDALKEAMREEG